MYYCALSIATCLAHGKDSLPPPPEPVTADKAILKLEEDFKTASNYLDFRNLSPKIRKIPEEELTKKLEIILDHAVWIDIVSLSDNVTG